MDFTRPTLVEIGSIDQFTEKRGFERFFMRNRLRQRRAMQNLLGLAYVLDDLGRERLRTIIEAFALRFPEFLQSNSDIEYPPDDSDDTDYDDDFDLDPGFVSAIHAFLSDTSSIHDSPWYAKSRFDEYHQGVEMQRKFAELLVGLHAYFDFGCGEGDPVAKESVVAIMEQYASRYPEFIMHDYSNSSDDVVTRLYSSIILGDDDAA